MATRVLGIKEMEANIKRFNAELEAAEDPAARAAGVVIRDAWRGLVPVLDANYQRSLEVGGKKGQTVVGPTWLPDLPRGEQPVMYAKGLEFGNSRQTPQPSARPALEASRSEAMLAGEVPIESVLKGSRTRRKRTPKA